MKKYRVVTRADAIRSDDIRGIIHVGHMHMNYSEERAERKPLAGALKGEEEVTVKMLRGYLEDEPWQLLGLCLRYINRAGDPQPTSTLPIVEIFEIEPSDEFRNRPEPRRSLYGNKW